MIHAPEIDQKLADFHFENTAVIADFDRTISVGDYHSWSVFEHALGQEYFDAYHRLFQTFHPIEIDPTISEGEKGRKMKQWWDEHISLLGQVSLASRHFHAGIINRIKVRRGFHETFSKLREHGVPVMVFSAGISQVIRMVLERDFGTGHGIDIVSNELHFCPQGISKGVAGPTIHTHNKTEVELGHLFPSQVRESTHRIIFGDSLSDLHMAHAQKRFSVGFLNKPNDTSRTSYRASFNAVIESPECDLGFGTKLLSHLGIQ